MIEKSFWCSPRSPEPCVRVATWTAARRAIRAHRRHRRQAMPHRRGRRRRPQDSRPWQRRPQAGRLLRVQRRDQRPRDSRLQGSGPDCLLVSSRPQAGNRRLDSNPRQAGSQLHRVRPVGSRLRLGKPAGSRLPAAKNSLARLEPTGGPRRMPADHALPRPSSTPCRCLHRPLGLFVFRQR